MNPLNEAIANANRIMSGEQSLEVTATIKPMDAMMVAVFLFVAVFAGTSLANILTR